MPIAKVCPRNKKHTQNAEPKFCCISVSKSYMLKGVSGVRMLARASACWCGLRARASVHMCVCVYV